jgi:hypothetical protein
MKHYKITVNHVDGESVRGLLSPEPKEVLGFLRHCDHEGSVLTLLVINPEGKGEEKQQYFDGDSEVIYQVLEDAATEMA